ncbi:SIR2 family protein [Rhodococcus erythropolis]|uniref:SIR2 family protein n=1 Tax=Rhodococcus erythropolis TaxID=1833 RepID=UPI002227E1DA|nr:SIR2 family protein [Rhodococcus erythropolis]MCW2295353.1 hypothetical protein [Rhodococcus erythropolis]
MTATPARPPAPYDSSAMLALSVHANPGIYALIAGSGISFGAGVPTGWGVIQELVRRMASVADPDTALGTEFDAEKWWAETFPSKELGYDAVLEACTLTPTERRRFLEPFFVPTDEELEAGTKTPAEAHRAIARLVKRGSIKVIVTTNFDDLLEKALDAQGVPYQVISSSRDIAGAEPLRHNNCTIIKVHGDYRQTDQLNTRDELATYQQEINDLLTVVFDEYGLITCGWSADWDAALVDAITRATSRRYPMYWANRGALGVNANRLVDHRRGTVVPIDGADTFFGHLADRLDVLDRMTSPPLTLDLAIGQLKRYLPDPARRIDLRDLFDDEIQRIRTVLDSRSLSRDRNSPDEIDGVNVLQIEADHLTDLTSTLMHLLAHGITLDTTREHDNLWIWVVEQLMRACRQTPRADDPNKAISDTWKYLGYLPAWLALQAASFAAVLAKRDDLLIRLHFEPTTHDPELRDPAGDRVAESPAVAVLYEYRLFPDLTNTLFPRIKSQARPYHFSDSKLQPLFEPIVGNKSAYLLLAERTEYRKALIQIHRGSPHCWLPVLSHTTYDGDGNFRTEPWRLTTDFDEHASDLDWTTNLKTDKTKLKGLTIELEATARSQKWW